MAFDTRHCNKNGEINRKHGNTLISTLRRTYGPPFAAGCDDDQKLGNVLQKSAAHKAGSGRNGRITMKHFLFLIAFSGLLLSVVSGPTEAAYYYHRHHHYWHHGGGGSYWNYYRTSWPGRGISEESQR